MYKRQARGGAAAAPPAPARGAVDVGLLSCFAGLGRDRGGGGGAPRRTAVPVANLTGHTSAPPARARPPRAVAPVEFDDGVPPPPPDFSPVSPPADAGAAEVRSTRAHLRAEAPRLRHDGTPEYKRPPPKGLGFRCLA